MALESRPTCAGAPLSHRSGVSICTSHCWPIISRFHGVRLSNPPVAPFCSLSSVRALTCGCLSPWALQPSRHGSTQQSRSEGGQLGRFLLGGCDGCLSSPGEADKPSMQPPHVLKNIGANIPNQPACKAWEEYCFRSGNAGTLRGDTPKEQPHVGVSSSTLLCYMRMGPLHTPPRGARLQGS